MTGTMDGKLMKTITAETKPSGLVYFDPYSEEEIRLFLPEGEHVFRAAFLNDDFVTKLTPRELYDRRKNKFVDSMTFVGPFAPKEMPPARRRDSVRGCAGNTTGISSRPSASMVADSRSGSSVV